MTRERTLREAHHAQLLEESDRLVDRVLELAPIVEAAKGSLRMLEHFEEQVQALAEHTQRAAVEHIVEQTNALAAQHRERLELAFADAATAATAAWRNASAQHADAINAQILATLSRHAPPRRSALWAGATLASGLIGVLAGAVIVTFAMHGGA
jgi:quinol monooxygenase YgiN